ncbi:MAG: lipopolysaccharide biosynthesis protein, partial [Chloroflexota bacterium]
MSEVKRIGKHSLVYGAGIVASKLASFLMLPIYTRFLTPADYGVLELLSMTIDVIGTIAGVGLGSAVFKFFEDYDNPDDRNEVMSTSAIGVVGLALVTALLGLTFAPVLNGLILPEHGDPLYFRLFVFIYLAQSCEIVPLFLIRAQERSKLFVTLS